MEIWGLVGIILAIIIILAILKFVFKMVKLVFWIVVIIFIITSVLGIFTYRDALDMKENLESQPKIYFLKQDETLVSGFSIGKLDEVPEFFDFSKIVEYQNNFKNKDYEDMLDENYKIFILDMETFDFNDENIEFIGGEVSKKTLQTVLNSDDPIEVYKSKTNINVRNYGIEDPGEFKGNIFATLFNEKSGSMGQLFIMIEYKKGNVIVYPETASFKMIKLLPTSFIKNVFEKAKDKAVEEINNSIRGD
jgi:energy-coupling factor transporter transmembrane protein EcfT